MPSWLQHSPATYSAWIAGTALLATLFAAVIAYRQLRLARDVRLKQAQPSVVAFEAFNAAHVEVIELVIRNFGPTPAYDVRLSSDPVMRRTGDTAAQVEDVWLPEVIPMLAPGQEWRTVWDFAPDRLVNGTLDKRHKVTLTYSDWRGNALSSRAILDWAAYDDRHYAETFTVHNVAKTLRDIDKRLVNMNQLVARQASKTGARDGDSESAELESKIPQGKVEQLFVRMMRRS